MVTLRFVDKASILATPLFTNCVHNCRKVEKLQFDDVKMDNETADKILKTYEATDS